METENTEPKPRKVTVVVNGQPIKLRARDRESLMRKALERTGNAAAPDVRWELRDMGGNIVESENSIFGAAKGEMYFLSLKAGVGGEGELPSKWTNTDRLVA